jgi:puromycin-sensitive aminopeptidase
MTDVAAGSGTDPSAAHRLPYSVEPSRYELRLAPDLEAARFRGEVRIDALVHEPVREIAMHAVDLQVSSATVAGAGGPARAATVVADPGRERVLLQLESELSDGPVTIELAFDGELNDMLHGFYRSTFVDADGDKRTIATTQFEATDARRAFPCFDEPDRKAVFSVTLDVAEGLQAVSNGPVVTEEPLPNGARRIRFGDTIPMSTYLVAFVVGPLVASEPMDAGGTPVRVVHVPGKGHLTGFALDVARHALAFFSEWFGIPYPGHKLDLVAIPDFAFGAMENLGCVTFRESALLIDPASASRLELERIADVVAHEIAHMWFGDLVTMKWWNGIWLNEAFATLMELLCVDAFRPEWQRWLTFGLEREAAFATDALHSTRPVEYPVGPPEEAQGMFDVLTYQKGAGVLRMLERFIGPPAFRDGIRRYLDAHRLGNTETADLWDALEATSGQPVRTIMDTWILQGGFPLVTVSDGGARLSQAPFAYGPTRPDAPSAIGSAWQVPVLARALGHGGGEPARVLLGPEPVDIAIGTSGGDVVVVNAGGAGFYRVAYGDREVAALAARLDELEPLERFNLLGDTWAAVVAGRSPLDAYLSLAEALDDDDPDVWAQVTGPIALLDRVVDDESRRALAAYARAVLGPVLARLGWEPVSGESERTPTLRSQLIAALGTVGEDDTVLARARSLFAASLRTGPELPPDLAGAILAVVAAAGGAEEHGQFVDRYRRATTPQEELRFLMALAGFRDLQLARATFDMARTEVRTQNAPMLVHGLLANRDCGPAMWAALLDHWDEVIGRIPLNTAPRLLEGVRFLCRDGSLAREVAAFVAAHPLAVGARTVTQAVERMFVNVAFADRMRREADSALAAATARVGARRGGAGPGA